MRASCDGLVIRETEYGENDRLVTVLTAEHGQMLMIAKGARSLKSKTMSLCRLFTYANFEYYEKNGRYWLSGGSVNDSFFGISSDIQGFALASYVVQLASEITGEEAGAERTLRMTLNTLYAIEKRLKPFAQIKSVYEIFASEESGFSPDIDGCDMCGDEKPESDFWLDIMNGRLVCGKCLSQRNATAEAIKNEELRIQSILVPMDISAVSAWEYVRRAELKRIFSFELASAESLERLAKASEAYITNHLERSFETLEFYNAVKE
ncbi:MAG: DNA repair protein RecO [Clostridia bacterium]|nr:DNA repair protein RecO [Clostridia bacterium]